MFESYYTVDEFKQFSLDIPDKYIDENNMVRFSHIFDSFHDSHFYNRYITKIL